MRGPLLVAAALLAAGCVSLPDVRKELGVPTAAEAWALDCGLGASEPGWAQPCVARASHTDGPKQEIWLAVNPADPDNVVLGSKDNRPASSNYCTWNGLAVTKDGGRSWADVTIGGDYGERAPGSPYFGYSCNTDPMMAFDTNGTLYYVVEMYNAGGPNGSGPLGPDPLNGRALLLAGWKLVLAHSFDGGLSWPDDQTVTLDQIDGVVGINDYSRIAWNPATGSVVTAINTFSGGPFFLASTAYSVCDVIVAHANGTKADPPLRLVPKDPNLRGLGCQVVAANPASGRLVLGASNNGATMWARSGDDGKTWTDWAPGFTFKPIPGTFNESKYRTGTNFEAAYAADGTLYVAYAARGSDDADVFLAKSADDGRTWSPAVQVNEATANATHQFIPNLAIAGDGSIHVFFLDKQYDPEHKLIDVTHAVSDDGGATWASRRVTNVSFDGDLGVHQEGFPFIGDYIGAGAVGSDVWAGFPDASTGTTVIAAAHAFLKG